MKGLAVFVAGLVSLAALSASARAGAAEGGWLFKKDNADQLDRALFISGSSFQSLISTEEGVAWETGWWTENGSTPDGKTRVVVRYGSEPAENIFYKMSRPDYGEIWLEGASARWGVMERSQCKLTMQYRNWSDPAPTGCAWLHIKGWGYSALDGECMYNDDWAANPPPPGPMECLIEAPEGFVR